MSKKSPKNIALTGGGTGGHIYPCLAIAENLKEKAKIYYIGNSNKLEAELLGTRDLKDHQEQAYSSYIKFLGIEAKPLVNKVNPFQFIPWLWDFYQNTLKAKRHLEENSIDIVFGTGGYVAAPVFAAAIWLKIPYIIHNLDAHMGLANRVFVNDAYALTTAFDNLDLKPKNGNRIITGNPISAKFLRNLEGNSESGLGIRDLVLVTGGSQGAQNINEAIGNLLPKIDYLNIVHITGAKNYEEHIKKFPSSEYYQVEAYSHEMPQLCSRAAIAICRAGAMTCAEMAASGVVPIFVPLPWAAHDHQTKNAKAFVDAKAGISIEQPAKSNDISQKDFEKELLKHIRKLTENNKQLNKMQANLEKLAYKDAAEKLATLILKS